MDGAAMDGAAMEGPLFVQSQRFGAKKWKKTWAVLYPSSPNGVARLEFFEHKGSGSGGGWGGSRRLDCRVIRLSDCVSVAPVTLDSPPGPGTSAFRLDTAQRSHLLAAEGPASVAWVQILCQTAFPKGCWSQSPGESSSGPSTMEMQENSLYSPHGQGCEFWVTIQKTEASEHCRLQGHYVLRVEASGLSLLMLGGQGQKKEPLLSWPYTLLRRYGRDRAMFSFEAGRRCPSGPGTFTFQTSQGNDIFQAVEAAIQRQKAQAGIAGPGPGQDQQCPGSSEAGMAGPGAAPPAPYGLEGPHAADGPALYSEPLDALRALPNPSPDPLYSDPVDSSGQRTGPGAGGSSPLYWGLFDQVQQQLKDTKLGGAKKEPIYDEPEGQSPAPSPGLYDKPQEPRDAWCQRARAQEEGYELPYNPGMDDYAVPPLRNLKPIPPPKPQMLPGPNSPGSQGLPLYSRVLKGAAAKGWDQRGPESGSQTRTGMRSEGPM